MTDFEAKIPALRNYAILKGSAVVGMFDALQNPERYADFFIREDMGNQPIDTVDRLVKDPVAATPDKSRAILWQFSLIARHLFGEEQSEVPVDSGGIAAEFLRSVWVDVPDEVERVEVETILPPSEIITDMVMRSCAQNPSLKTARIPSLEAFIDRVFRVDPGFPRRDPVL